MEAPVSEVIDALNIKPANTLGFDHVSFKEDATRNVSDLDRENVVEGELLLS